MDKREPPGTEGGLTDTGSPSDDGLAPASWAQFLARVSHEVRTPLAGILVLSRLARDALPRTPERAMAYLDRLARSAQALEALVNDLLDCAKLEVGKLQLHPMPFDLHELLHAVHEAHVDQAREARLWLTLEIAPELPRRIVADPLRLRQVLANYLSNALKFTRSGRVTLAAGIRPGQEQGQGQPPGLRLEVIDTGIGIAPELLDRLFEPYVQALAPQDAAPPPGTGLGLSICRDLALLMGGQVGASSQPGQGSRFWLDLPLQSPPAPAPDPKPDRDRASAGAHAQPTAKLPQGLRILLAEDNAVCALTAKAQLATWNCTVHAVSDGRQALQALLAGPEAYDLVLMDLQMPELSGLQVARRWRALSQQPHPPILALTATDIDTVREACRDAGMAGLLTKPIQTEALAAELARLGVGHRAAPPD